MSIFSNLNQVESEIVVAEGYDITLGGAYDTITESYTDDLILVEAMHAYDMAELDAVKESGGIGNEYVITSTMEASIKDMWTKIKEAFKKMAGRVLAFFSNAGAYMANLVLSGATFAEKYEDRLKNLKLNQFSYTMYVYDFNSAFDRDISMVNQYHNDVKKSMSDIANVKIDGGDGAIKALEKIQKDLANDNTKRMDKLRTQLAGKASADEFRSALAKKFRGGTDKGDRPVNDLSKYIKFLKDSKGLAKHITDQEAAIKRVFGEMETAINKAATDAEGAETGDDSKKASVAAKKGAVMRSILSLNANINSVLTIYINEWSSVVKEATGVYKSLCVAALKHASK